MTTIIYWMSDILADGSVYIQVVLIFILNVQVAISLSTFVSVLAGTVDIALAIIIPVILPLLIFSGFFLNNNSVPDYFIWIKYLSWMFYCNESVNIVVWENTGSIPCTTKNSNSSCPGRFCYDDGGAVLEFLDFNSVFIICY